MSRLRPLPAADVLSLICAIVIGFSFVALPWNKALDNRTAAELRTASDIIMPITFYFIPFATAIAAIAALLGIFRPKARRTGGLFILAAGILGMLFFVKEISGVSFAFLNTYYGIGFWLIFAGEIGFVAQVLVRFVGKMSATRAVVAESAA